jgi:plasmid stabilization system protein ParE
VTTVRFNSLAEEELNEAAARYEAERKGLGYEFLEEISKALALLSRFPQAAPVARGSIRSLVVSRFPYKILYRPLPGGGLRVLAVAHHKRRPGYWTGRR